MLTVCRISQSWGTTMSLSTLGVCCIARTTFAYNVPATAIPFTDNNRSPGRKPLTCAGPFIRTSFTNTVSMGCVKFKIPLRS